MTPPTNDLLPYLPDPTQPRADEVLKAIEMSAIRSAVGGSRLTCTRLQELVHEDGSDMVRSLQRHLGKLADRIVSVLFGRPNEEQICGQCAETYCQSHVLNGP